MFGRFKRGVTPASVGKEAYSHVEDYVPDDYDGSEDGDQSELIGSVGTDPHLVLVHEREEHVGP